MLKDTDVVTRLGKFSVDSKGVTDVPDVIAQELIDDGLFEKIVEDKVEEPKPETPKKTSK